MLPCFDKLSHERRVVTRLLRCGEQQANLHSEGLKAEGCHSKIAGLKNTISNYDMAKYPNTVQEDSNQ